MTRKRYCKLMIAKGWSRNAANASARNVKQSGSYEKLYEISGFSPSAIEVVMKRVAKNIKPTVQFCCSAIADGLKRMSETFREIGNG